MRWVKHVIVVLLVVATAVVGISALFGDHRSDYGQVQLPAGGVAHFPKGDVVVYWRAQGEQDVDPGLTGTLNLTVTPAGGGPEVPRKADEGGSDESLQRSEAIGELGAITTLKVPADGDYMVSGGDQLTTQSTVLSFGVNSATAMLHRWKLVAILLGAALLISLIPVPRGRSRWDEPGEAPGWSADSRAPYAG